MHQLVAEAAERDPGHAAVVGADRALSYADLEELSSQIGRQLRDDGLRPGDRAGVLAAKSPDAVAALLGIQKAGAAYVPVDPYSPAQRAAYILGDCGVRALVTTAAKAAELPLEQLAARGLETVVLLDEGKRGQALGGPAALSIRGLDEIRATQSKDHFEASLTDHDLAYILYTSGSTGEPKGVMISHLNSLTFVNWCRDAFQVKAGDRVANHSPFHFDLSVFDLFCTFKAGGAVFLVPQPVALFPRQLAAWIAETGISIWYSVPSALIRLVEDGRLERYRYEGLRAVLFAGEVFPIKYLQKLAALLPDPAYYNLYGPTETNVCTHYRVRPADLDPGRAEPVCIGKACANTQVFAVTSRGGLAAPGEEGELYVRGSAVMKGYWGRPQDTRNALVANFLNPQRSEVLYRTGDIVRQLASGDYQYVGRRDRMVKSRGYRVELGEVEAALYAHPDVLEAAVVAVADERVGARLKAYVVARGAVGRGELESFCRRRLPRYMVPELWETRARLPKTSTGKTDKGRLEREGLIP